MIRVIFSIILVASIQICGGYVINSTYVKTDVLAINFDSDGNIYVLATVPRNESNQLHKLTSTNELVWTITLPPLDSYNADVKLLVTSKNDVYLRYASYYDGVTFLYGIKSGSSNLTEIDYVRYACELFILDGNDNLFYCGANYAFKILRPNSTSPTEIKNLGKLGNSTYRKESVTVDREGNVYFPISQLFDLNSDQWLALITKDEIENEIPEAKLIDIFNRNNGTTSRAYISSVIVDEKNDLWLFITDLTNSTGYIKKVKNSILETVYTDYARKNVQGLLAKDKLYVISQTAYYLSNNTNIFYIIEGDRVGEIPALTNITESLEYFKVAADKDGNAYFANYYDISPELGSFVVIKANQTDPIPIKLGDHNWSVSLMKSDSDGTLWIYSASAIYTLEKDNTTAEQILNFYDLCRDINFSPVTKGVYFSCYEGLFYAVDNN